MLPGKAMIPCVITLADAPLGLQYKDMRCRLVLSPFTVAAVSSAAHSLPLAYETCCMRESLLGGLVSGLINGPPAIKKKRQQPVPNGVEKWYQQGTVPAGMDQLSGTSLAEQHKSGVHCSRTPGSLPGLSRIQRLRIRELPAHHFVERSGI